MGWQSCKIGGTLAMKKVYEDYFDRGHIGLRSTLGSGTVLLTGG